MKVIHISTYDKEGGAAIAAFRLHSAMLLAGVESKMLVCSKKSKEPTVIASCSLLNRFRNIAYVKIESILKKGFNPNYTFSLGIFGAKIANYKEIKEADVVYVHWTSHCFLSIKGMKQILSLGKPVICFMHDMWTITGGCHYSFNCDNYAQMGCSNCPFVVKNNMFNWESIVYRLKSKHLKSCNNLYFSTPSSWLKGCVKNSLLFGDHIVKVIPNLLDVRIFKPINKIVARSILNLPHNKKIILFGADYGTENPYKGWEYLKEAMPILATKDVELAVFGNKLSQREIAAIPYKVHSVGQLYDEYSLALLYNAVDLLVVPSLADNLPNTILESLFCGTPVVAFQVGGIPDLVEHMQTGYLAKYQDSHDLANGIDWTLESYQSEENKNKLLDYITREYSADKILDKHQQYWKEILHA